MDSTNSGVMLALLPNRTDWCQLQAPDFAHLTLVYAGQTKDLSPGSFSQLAKMAVSISRAYSPVRLQTVGVDQFGDGSGDNPKVDVLTFADNQTLMDMRALVEKWNASSFPFSPHATIGPEGSAPDLLPSYLSFGQIVAAWGSRVLTYDLGNSGSYASYDSNY